MSTHINVLLKLTEATWLVLRSGSSDTQSHIVPTARSVSVVPLLTGIREVSTSMLNTGRESVTGPEIQRGTVIKTALLFECFERDI